MMEVYTFVTIYSRCKNKIYSRICW